MHAFAVSRPLLLCSVPCASLSPSACARRPNAPSAPVVTSRARATLSSDSDAPKAASSAMNSSQGLSVPPPVPDAPVPGLTAGLTPGDEVRISAVRTQMEFWFSSSNLKRDWYLRRQMDDGGWLDPSVFLLFNRIKNLNADLNDIILACRFSEELEVSSPGASSFGDDAGQTRVRRSPDLPDFRGSTDDEASRSFIVKGIPADSTVDSLLVLFAPLGPISYARLYRSKNFPDTPRALICFPDQQTADAAQEIFLSDKPEEMKDLSMRRRDRSAASSTANNTSSSLMEARPTLLICHITGLAPDLDWKDLYKILDAIFTERTGESMRYLMYSAASEECYITCNDSETARSLLADLAENGIQIRDLTATLKLLEDEEDIKGYWQLATEHQNARKARRAREAQTFSSSSDSAMRFPSGVIVKVNGLPEDTTWRQLKIDLGRLGKLVYLNFDRGSPFCYARFSSPEEAVAVKDVLVEADGAQLCDVKVDAFVLEGEEEIGYWVRAEESQRGRQNNNRYSPPSEAL